MSKGKLYTTYFAKHSKAIGHKISIVRYTPKWLNLEELDIHNLIDLSPSSDLLMAYKNSNCNWDTYTELFEEQMEFCTEMGLALEYVKSLLDNGEDVTLICYEKSGDECHRSLIAKYFRNLGYYAEEIKF